MGELPPRSRSSERRAGRAADDGVSISRLRNDDFDYFSIRWMMEGRWGQVHPILDPFHEVWRTPSKMLTACRGDEYVLLILKWADRAKKTNLFILFQHPRRGAHSGGGPRNLGLNKRVWYSLLFIRQLRRSFCLFIR